MRVYDGENEMLREYGNKNKRMLRLPFSVRRGKGIVLFSFAYGKITILTMQCDISRPCIMYAYKSRYYMRYAHRGLDLVLGTESFCVIRLV